MTTRNSGNTEYRIKIPVKARPKPEAVGGTGETTLENIMSAVNQIADRKADTLDYKNSVLRLLSGETELSRVIIRGGSGGGADAREIELRKSATTIQWRYVGDDTWNDLVTLAEITGARGENRVLRAILERQGLRVNKESKVQRGRLVRKANRVLKENRARKVNREFKGYKAPPDLKANPVYKARRDQLV